MEKKNKNGVVFFKAEFFTHKDKRRAISDLSFPPLINFQVRQMKRIDFWKKTIIGNHYHTKESKRIEVYIAVGPSGKELFEFFYREKGGKIRRKKLFSGSGCVIPPLHSHAFGILSEKSSLWGLSNLSEYDPKGDIKDILAG